MAAEKTNAMRILDKSKISYEVYAYTCEDGVIDAVHTAEVLGLPPEMLYKTLVTRGASGKDFFVFVIPSGEELDLKAAARAVGQKSISMLHVAELQSITGYIRGGCSPVGMKKQYKTVIDASCLHLERMIVSGGRIGRMIALIPGDLLKITRGITASICMA